MTYWIDVYSPGAWEEYKEFRYSFSGFPENRRTTVKRIKKHDILICYMKGKSIWFAAFKVTSDKPYWCDKPRAYREKFCPWRVNIQNLVIVNPDNAINAKETVPILKLFGKLKNPANWGPPLHTSLREIGSEDGNYLLKLLKGRARHL